MPPMRWTRGRSVVPALPWRPNMMPAVALAALLRASLHAFAAGRIAVLVTASFVRCIETPPPVFAPPTVLIITLTLSASARARLIMSDAPDPTNTGLPSLDRLNRAWRVTHMTLVFPDVDPPIQPLAPLRMMAHADAADLHVASVEIPGDISIP